MCEDCGHIFNEEDAVKYLDRHGFNDSLGEEFRLCPKCKSTEISIAQYCYGCDEYFIGDYVEVANGDTYCENCFMLKNTYDD